MYMYKPEHWPKELDLGVLGLVEASIEYVVHGCYRAATRDDPEEWPEIELYTVVINIGGKDVDIIDELSEDELRNIRVEIEEG